MGGASSGGRTRSDLERLADPGRVMMLLVTAAVTGIGAAAIASVITFRPSEPMFSGVTPPLSDLRQVSVGEPAEERAIAEPAVVPTCPRVSLVTPALDTVPADLSSWHRSRLGAAVLAHCP